MPKPRILASRTVAAIQHAHDLSDAALTVLWAAIDDEYDDGAAVIAAARDAADAAESILALYGAFDEEAMTFALSSVLSIVTGKMVADGGPDWVAELLSWMTGHTFGPGDLRSPLADVAAARCRAALLDQHPALARPLPAVPRVKLSDPPASVRRPPVIAAWVAIIAEEFLGVTDGADPLLVVRRLPVTVRGVFA